MKLFFRKIHSIVVTEQVTFGTVANGLINCKKFDETDAVFVCKYL